MNTIVGVLFVIAIAMTLLAIWWRADFLGERARKRLRKNGIIMVAKAKKVGVVLRYNEVAGVLGLCSERDFQAGYQKFLDQVAAGEKKVTDKVVVFGFNTFTFWKRVESQTLIHTGNTEQLEKIVNALIEAAIGFKKEDVDGVFYQFARDILLSHDSRLFVPFAGGMPNLPWQEEFYGRTTPEWAQEYLLSKTVRQLLP